MLSFSLLSPFFYFPTSFLTSPPRLSCSPSGGVTAGPDRKLPQDPIVSHHLTRSFIGLRLMPTLLPSSTAVFTSPQTHPSHLSPPFSGARDHFPCHFRPCPPPYRNYLPAHPLTTCPPPYDLPTPLRPAHPLSVVASHATRPILPHFADTSVSSPAMAVSGGGGGGGGDGGPSGPS